jgi:PAS domain S-box-containing protein
VIVAGQPVIAVDDHTARRQLERLVAAQVAVSELLAADDLPGDLLREVTLALTDALGWETGTLWTKDPDTGELGDEPVRASLPRPADLRKISTAAAQEAWATASTVVRSAPTVMVPPGTGLWMPVTEGGTPTAVIEVLTPGALDFDSAGIDLLSSIGAQVGKAMLQHREVMDHHALALRDLNFLTTLLDNTEEGVVACDETGHITLFNRAMRDLLGRPDTPIALDDRPRHFGLGEPSTGEPLVAARMPLVRALAGEIVRSEEVLVTDPSDRTRILTVNARQLVAPDGTILGAVGVAHDVTELRTTLERMEEAERLACVGTWEVDIKTRDVFWSAGLYRLFGLEPGSVEPSEEAWRAAVHPADADAALRRVMAAVEGGEQVWEDDYRVVLPDGSVRTVHITAASALHPDGSLRSVRGTAQDTTVSAEAETRAGEIDRMEALGQLAGGIAHDFNNLLAVILSYTEFALEDLPASSSTRPDIEEVRRAAERAADLTRRLLVFSHREVVHPELVDMGGLLKGLEPLLVRTLGEQLEIRVEVAAAIEPVNADPGELEQMLLNLALNARDAMPDGGVLSITVDGTDIGLGADPLVAGRFLRIRVSDTGVGMSPEVASHVFEPFFTTKPKGRGTGLGLSTVYGAVSEMKGSISVRSSPGIGSTFTVLMPVANSQTAPRSPKLAAAARAHAPEARPAKRVLLVEDDDAVRRATSRILRREGCRVLEAASGEQALKILAECGGMVDLLLTDVVMPGMSGWEMHTQVIGHWPGIPAIFMSGYTDDVVGREAIAAGGFDFIAKPFAANELLALVRSLLLT